MLWFPDRHTHTIPSGHKCAWFRVCLQQTDFYEWNTVYNRKTKVVSFAHIMLVRFMHIVCFSSLLFIIAILIACIPLLDSVQSLNCVWLFGTPWIAARQASLSITNSQSLLKLMSIESTTINLSILIGRPFRLFSVWGLNEENCYELSFTSPF